MNLVKNIFAVIGGISVIVLVFLLIKIMPILQQLDELDPRAGEMYLNIMERIVTSQSAMEAMVVKVPVKEGVTANDVDNSIRSIASELNIKHVGDLPMYKEVEAMSGTPYRYTKIYLLCSAISAASMLDFNDAFASYLPCRITLIEDKQGKLWLYTHDMDLMIYGGKTLPPALKAETIKVRDIILKIMHRAAAGDF